MEKDCVFCRIVSRELPSSVVYEDALVIAFVDITPVNPGHCLVIPRHHATYLADLPPSESGPLFEAARKVAAALRASELRCDGLNLYLADGEAAGQDVFHVHLHVIPRWPGDGAGYRRPPGYGARPARSELDVTAAVIRQHIG